MKRTAFQPNSRQTEILKVIAETGFAETEAIAKSFSRTMQTIRRDFKMLERHGFVKHVHGGARANVSDDYKNRPYSKRLTSNALGKHLIGKTAATLIPNDKCIFLSLGTSTEFVARHLLEHKNMRFATNNLNIAHILRNNPYSEIQVCGGIIRQEDGGILDPRAIELISNLRIDYSIIGIGAIIENGGLFCYSIDEVRTAQTIIQNSDITILVADEQKFGSNANYKMGNLEDINIFITDKLPNPDIAGLCEERGVKLLLTSNIQD